VRRYSGERRVDCGCIVVGGHVSEVGFRCPRRHFQGALYQPPSESPDGSLASTLPALPASEDPAALVRAERAEQALREALGVVEPPGDVFPPTHPWAGQPLVPPEPAPSEPEDGETAGRIRMATGRSESGKGNHPVSTDLGDSSGSLDAA
jgi:hypothetical protein